jgi:hypothetical protein
MSSKPSEMSRLLYSTGKPRPESHWPRGLSALLSGRTSDPLLPFFGKSARQRSWKYLFKSFKNQ